MNKFKEIAQSWYNVMFEDTIGKKLADERFAKCLDCEHIKRNEIGVFYYCGACGCPLVSKIRSPMGKQACPKSKWDN